MRSGFSRERGRPARSGPEAHRCVEAGKMPALPGNAENPIPLAGWSACREIYLPLNSGLRPSLNARTPSARSSVSDQAVVGLQLELVAGVPVELIGGRDGALGAHDGQPGRWPRFCARWPGSPSRSRSGAQSRLTSPPREGLLGGERLPGEDDLLGPPHADRSGQVLGAHAAGHDAQRGLGECEPGAGGRGR